MENFIVHNPTVLHFGRDVVNELGNTVAKYGKRVLLVYGKGSVKQTGLYQQILQQLTKVKAEVYEYSGIKPNPVVEDVDAAAALGRAKAIDVIVAVGGGSVIDSAKVISITIPAYQSAWDFFAQKAKPTSAIPVMAVLTLAATGTEMNPFAVLQNVRSKNKQGFGNPLMYPRHSFLDPSNTFSVPKNYTAYGVVDLIAHALESYFGKGDASLSDKIVFSVIKEAMEYGPDLLKNLRDYDLRARIMYAATLALNGITINGRVSGEWGVHSIGHVISVLYDTPHGATLSIAYPAWLKLVKDQIPERIQLLGKNLFNTDSIDKTIEKLEALFKKLESPVRLKEIKLTTNHHQQIIDQMIKSKVNGANIRLTEEDYPRLVSFMA
ncbi:MAG: iron-containing alcohol dehydrogenase [Bacteroidetes bacterium]|nr:iron-containing alcohol dehydrogenase [Bacteroidota bacterium]